MKQPLAIRIDADLLAAARECARRDNRTLTNFIETVLRRRIDEIANQEGRHVERSSKETPRDA